MSFASERELSVSFFDNSSFVGTHKPNSILHPLLTGSNKAPVLSCVLKPRSLLVFADQAYTECLHGIDAVRQDTFHS